MPGTYRMHRQSASPAASNERFASADYLPSPAPSRVRTVSPTRFSPATPDFQSDDLVFNGCTGCGAERARGDHFEGAYQANLKVCNSLEKQNRDLRRHIGATQRDGHAAEVPLVGITEVCSTCRRNARELNYFEGRWYKAELRSKRALEEVEKANETIDSLKKLVEQTVTVAEEESQDMEASYKATLQTRSTQIAELEQEVAFLRRQQDYERKDRAEQDEERRNCLRVLMDRVGSELTTNSKSRGAGAASAAVSAIRTRLQRLVGTVNSSMEQEAAISILRERERIIDEEKELINEKILEIRGY